MTKNTHLFNHDILIYEMRKKSIGVAYALWVLLGYFDIHYFLGNRTKVLWRLVPYLVLSSAILWLIFEIAFNIKESIMEGSLPLDPLVSSIVEAIIIIETLWSVFALPLIGYLILWIMWIIDACTLPEQVKRYNIEVLQGITRNANTE